MASLRDLRLRHQLFMRGYRYRSVDWHPGAVLEKDLHEAGVAVVTTAAFSTPDQPPFDASRRGGDVSFREILRGTDLASLRVHHRSDAFDTRGIDHDPNVALPLDRLEEMATEGSIAAVAPRHYSFMGSISAPGRLVAETAPEVARRLRSDAVDVVLLTPV